MMIMKIAVSVESVCNGILALSFDLGHWVTKAIARGRFPLLPFMAAIGVGGEIIARCSSTANSNSLPSAKQRKGGREGGSLYYDLRQLPLLLPIAEERTVRQTLRAFKNPQLCHLPNINSLLAPTDACIFNDNSYIFPDGVAWKVRGAQPDAGWCAFHTTFHSDISAISYDRSSVQFSGGCH